MEEQIQELIEEVNQDNVLPEEPLNVTTYDNTEEIDLLNTLNDSILLLNDSVLWLIGFLILILCILLIHLFFTSMKAGKK